VKSCSLIAYTPPVGRSEDTQFAEYTDVFGEIHQLINTFLPANVI